MIYISIAIVLATLIASAAYVWPKVVFLALQGKMATQQQEREDSIAEMLRASQDNATGTDDASLTYL